MRLDDLHLWHLADPATPRYIGALKLVSAGKGVSLHYGKDWLSNGFALSEDLPLIEHATMTLAQQAGITTAETQVIRLAGANALAIRRFDRAPGRRMHSISAGTAIRATTASGNEPELGYAQLALILATSWPQCQLHFPRSAAEITHGSEYIPTTATGPNLAGWCFRASGCKQSGTLAWSNAALSLASVTPPLRARPCPDGDNANARVRGSSAIISRTAFLMTASVITAGSAGAGADKSGAGTSADSTGCGAGFSSAALATFTTQQTPQSSTATLIFVALTAIPSPLPAPPAPRCVRPLLLHTACGRPAPTRRWLAGRGASAPRRSTW